ncbi:MAG: hypothetical protein ABF969_11850 [Sporolactobacillus sp.]
MSTYKVIKPGNEVVVSGKKYPYGKEFEAEPETVKGALRVGVVKEVKDTQGPSQSVSVSPNTNTVSPSNAAQSNAVASTK